MKKVVAAIFMILMFVVGGLGISSAKSVYHDRGNHSFDVSGVGGWDISISLHGEQKGIYHPVKSVLIDYDANTLTVLYPDHHKSITYPRSKVRDLVYKKHTREIHLDPRYRPDNN